MPMAHPANVAVPLTAAVGFAVQLNTAPLGVVMASLIEFVPEVMFPPESSMATTGWVANAVPLTELDGEARKTSLVAEPKIENDALVAAVREPDVAVSVYKPAWLTRQPVKVATPATALFGFDPQFVSDPPPVPLSVSSTDAVLLVTVLPPASLTVTTGCLPNAVLRAVFSGVVVNTRLFAGPTDTVIVELTAEVRPGEVAVRV